MCIRDSTSTARKSYLSPIDANSCAANYVIFIGNGFPVFDQLAKSSGGTLTPPDTLKNVGAATAQLAMPQYSQITKGSSVFLDTDPTCYAGTTRALAAAACTSAAPSNYPNYFSFELSARSCSATGTLACKTDPA